MIDEGSRIKTGAGSRQRSKEKQSRNEKAEADKARIDGQQANRPWILDTKFRIEHDTREEDSDLPRNMCLGHFVRHLSQSGQNLFAWSG